MPYANKLNVCANTYLNHNNNDAKPSHQACIGCGSHQACVGCGSYQRGASGTGSRQLKCPTWGQTCSNCGKPNHILRVCQARKTPQAVKKILGANKAAMDTLIAHITFSQETGTYTFKDTDQIRVIDAYIVLFSPKLDPRQARDIPSGRSTGMTIFPDSGASVCFGGLKHLLNMGLTTNNLIPSRKVIWAVGGFTLKCQGWLPMEFIVHGKITIQALYICQKIQRLYFSKAACIDVGIQPKDFQNPMATIPPIADMAMQYIPLTST